MGTIILGLLIFGAAAFVVYKYWIKKDSICDCASQDCPAKKPNHKKS